MTKEEKLYNRVETVSSISGAGNIAAHGCNLKNERMILVHFQRKPFNITVIQGYSPTTDAEEADQFYEDLQDLEHQKRCPTYHRELECKSRKSRDTWNNRQVWPWSIKCIKAKANRILSTECTGHSKFPFSTT